MKFHRVRWKNFLSTGNAFTEFEVEPGLTMIVGDNGAGKSTLCDALSFGLFGTPFRKINKPQLINSINKKDMLVEVEFEEGGDEFLVRRGMKPTVFEIYKNGELLNQESHSRDYQEQLEKTVLRRNAKSFAQIEILGSRSYVPFMALPAGHRRAIVEDILDLQVFSVMSTLLKDNMSKLEEEIGQVELEKHKIEVNIAAKNRMAADAERRSREHTRDIERQIEQYEAKLDEQEAELSLLLDQQAEIEPKLEGFEKNERNRYKVKETASLLNRDLSALTKESNFFEKNTTCPTCTQEIDDGFRNAKLHSSKGEIEAIQEKIQILTERSKLYEERNEHYREVQAELSRVQTRVASVSSVIKNTRKTIQSLTDIVSKSRMESVQESIEDYDTEDDERQLVEVSTRYSRLLTERQVLKYAAGLLKDDGIKADVIAADIPTINALINSYLEAFDFFAEFVLDETFSEKILSRHRDEFSYHSFSEGEKARIDLAIMLTWREISKMKSSNSSNLLILDEVLDGSLNIAGREALLRLLGESGDFCTVVISHNTENIGSTFDRVMSFRKHKNFSEMEIE